MVDWHGSGGGSGAADPSWSGRYFSYGGRVIPVMAPTDARTGSAELAGRRSLAEARLADGIELPDPDTEEWRYSRISDLDLDAWAAAPADAGAPVPAEVTELLGSFGHLAGAVVLVDGAVVATRLDERSAAAGVHLGAAVDAEGGVAALGSVIGEGPDVLTTLNDARATDPVFVDIPRGVVVDAPIVIVDWVSSGGIAVHPRTVVRLGEDAQATVLEWRGSAELPALALPVTELSVARAARLRYGVVQLRGGSMWELATTSALVAQDASLSVAQAALGAEYGRSRVDCRLTGRGATGDLDAVYFARGTQTLDHRTFQLHDAPDTNSNLLFKGVVDDDARSVYTGLIRVEKDARGTNAFQTNRNLKLSDRAWAESVPNLEIETNDVRCSHASTVGPIEEDQRFYLESRGVPTEIAERLIVAGFLDEVLERFPVPAAAARISAEIARRLLGGGA